MFVICITSNFQKSVSYQQFTDSKLINRAYLVSCARQSVRGTEGLHFDGCILRNIQHLCLCTCPKMCIFIYVFCGFDALQTWTTSFIGRNCIFSLLIKYQQVSQPYFYFLGERSKTPFSFSISKNLGFLTCPFVDLFIGKIQSCSVQFFLYRKMMVSRPFSWENTLRNLNWYA